MSNTDEVHTLESDVKAIWGAKNEKSHVFLPGSDGYENSMKHYLDSSSDHAFFVVEPGSVGHLSQIMSLLHGRYKTTPFAVKGGGHATNPGFSSTKGVHISMTRFKEISWRGDILQVGAGCLFDDVYEATDGKSLNIVGGYHKQEIGVAGWLLGGGYSLKTNQYGLGIDNIKGFQVVLPDGSTLEVTDSPKEEHPDLFRALKGGGNNFGIVTRFDLQTHPQKEVFGGVLTYPDAKIESAKPLIASVVEKNPDKKFAMTAAFVSSKLDSSPSKFVLAVQYFFDDLETKLPNDLKEFAQKLTDLKPDGEALKQSSFNKYNWPISHDTGARGRWGTVMVSKVIPAFIDAVEQEARTAAGKLKEKTGWKVIIKFKFFNDNIFTINPDADSAWPPDRKTSYGPMLVFFLWKEEADDNFYIGVMEGVLRSIRKTALDLKCTAEDAPVYSNMALANFTNPKELYGENGLKALGEIRKKYDPKDVMSRAGGFRIPLPA